MRLLGFWGLICRKQHIRLLIDGFISPDHVAQQSQFAANHAEFEGKHFG